VGFTADPAGDARKPGPWAAEQVAVPSERTIDRILHRHGLLRSRPRKRWEGRGSRPTSSSLTQCRAARLSGLQKNQYRIFTVHRRVPTPLHVRASPSTSEQTFNIMPSRRFMIAHKHHSLSSRKRPWYGWLSVCGSERRAAGDPHRAHHRRLISPVIWRSFRRWSSSARARPRIKSPLPCVPARSRTYTGAGHAHR
jgi:hypothetical protein